MAKVQNDFYTRWAQGRIYATTSGNYQFDSKIEILRVDTPNAIDNIGIVLPRVNDDVLDGKEIAIADLGNASSFTISVITNPQDTSTIEGEAIFNITTDNARVIFRLIENVWTILVNTNPVLNLGSFHMHDNATITTISTVDTNTDIAGTATASSLNSNFTFGTSPNTLAYTGIKDIVVMLTITASMSKINSSDKVYRILGIKDDAEIEGCNIATNILKPMIEVSVSYPVALSTGSVIKAMVRNESDTENVDVTDLLLTMNEVIGC